VTAATPAATTTRGRGGLIELSVDKVEEMRKANAALIASKNQTRRVGSAGGESYIKRARRAAAGLDDEDGEFLSFYVAIILIVD
jgi:hypothetical protein